MTNVIKTRNKYRAIKSIVTFGTLPYSQAAELETALQTVTNPG